MLAAIGLASISGAAIAAEPAPTGTVAGAASSSISGIDLRYVDPAVRPQDDFYRAVNGKWLDTFEMPVDKARYGSFDRLREDTELQLKAIIEDATKSTDAPPGTEAQKIRDLYNSFMNEAKLEEVGTKPLAGLFARLDALKDKGDVAGLIASFNVIRVGAPFSPFVHQDNRDSSKYVVDLRQGGLGLPDRDYYLDDKFKDVRARYATHVEKMLAMAGDRDAATSAREVIALESGLARVQWTRVENRDPVKTYNKVELAQLAALAPGVDWKRWLADSGLDSRVDYVIVAQPSYMTAFAKLLDETPLPVWKAYFKWQLLNDAALYLPKAYVDEQFAFQDTVLRGTPENRPRWKRAVEFVDTSIGEALGKLYVARHFPPENKARMEVLVGNLLAAYRQSIDALDWMSAETKKEAKAKLGKFTPKIGYPTQWRDYTSLTVAKDDLVGNWMRAQEFEYRRNIAKLGKPIDRTEWGMRPYTVNAYYSREKNEIVFPAAILQPPFFNVAADDAVNYGGIGAVIGHEISHGFDDGGSRFDGDGNLHQWFTADDLKRFRDKTQALVAQYDQYEPVPGFHVNGALTLGENVADNSGLAIAYRAYKISLAGKSAPVIDGLTGEQRFYYGWAQVWRGKSRVPETIRLIKVDPHAPQQVRGLATLRNQPGFYEAFGVKEGDRMYLPPDQRITLW
ncbi:MAG TPA: M13-type metalloendopeptidase [Casimicrobiaceae bacterium]|nr:M13-type metalloendopeptidase [Casimicrobiaceae bacterium]